MQLISLKCRIQRRFVYAQCYVTASSLVFVFKNCFCSLLFITQEVTTHSVITPCSLHLTPWQPLVYILFLCTYLFWIWASQLVLVVKNPPANARDIRDGGLIPVLGRSPGGGQDNPLQCSCLENPMDRGSWWATVPEVTKSRT